MLMQMHSYFIISLWGFGASAAKFVGGRGCCDDGGYRTQRCLLFVLLPPQIGRPDGVHYDYSKADVTK